LWQHNEQRVKHSLDQVINNTWSSQGSGDRKKANGFREVWNEPWA